eukprot:3583793-Prymnesium_polylepis.2
MCIRDRYDLAVRIHDGEEIRKPLAVDGRGGGLRLLKPAAGSADIRGDNKRSASRNLDRLATQFDLAPWWNEQTDVAPGRCCSNKGA